MRFVVLLLLMTSFCFGLEDPAPDQIQGEEATMKSAVIYQPDNDLRQRIANAQVLAAYIKAVKPLVIAAVTHHSDQDFAVIVAWNNIQTLVYADAHEAVVKADVLSAADRIRKVPAPQVNGPVMFAIIFGFADSKERFHAETGTMPNAPEWLALSQKHGGNLPLPDCLFDATSAAVKP